MKANKIKEIIINNSNPEIILEHEFRGAKDVRVAFVIFIFVVGFLIGTFATYFSLK